MFTGIGVGSPERHGQGIKDSYITYRIASNYNGEAFNVSRRYTDFCELQSILQNNLPSIILPPLPEKQSLTQLLGGDRFNPELIKKRQITLTRWLKRINTHYRVIKFSPFKEFMCNTSVPDYSQTEKEIKDDVLDNSELAKEELFSVAKEEINLLNKHLKELIKHSEKWNKHQQGKIKLYS